MQEVINARYPPCYDGSPGKWRNEPIYTALDQDKLKNSLIVTVLLSADQEGLGHGVLMADRL